MNELIKTYLTGDEDAAESNYYYYPSSIGSFAFVFHGDVGANATLLGLTSDGTEYATCTTIQYGYKPSANTSVLSVTPQGTEVYASLEEMTIKQAQQNGWLTIWHEFTWWYPWYRLHIKVEINPYAYVALNPLLPGGEIQDFAHDILELIKDAALDVVIAYLITESAFRCVRSTGDIVTGVAAFLATTIAEYVLLGFEWNSPQGLKATVIASLISAFIAARGAMGALLELFEGLIEWFNTFCTAVQMLSGLAITLVGTILDVFDVVSNLVIFGLSIGRLIQLGALA